MEQHIPQQVLHYVTAEKLGEGFAGETHKAWDTVLERFVALKFLRPDLTGNTAFRAQCLATLRELTEADHPNIATIYGAHKIDTGYVIAMELVEGHTLRDVIRSGPIDNETFLHIARQTAAAINYAHKHHIVHGCFNPTSVMICQDDSVRLVDFGLSTLLIERENPDFVPSTEVVRYRAPEEITGEEITPMADLFSLGAVFYELLAGATAFPGQDIKVIEEAILRDEPNFARLLPDVKTPGDTVLVLEKLLAKKPADRFANAAELQVTLDEIVRFEENDKFREFLKVKPTTSREYLMISLLAALLLIFWLVITTVRH